MEIYLEPKFGRLHPSTADDADKIGKMKPGSVYKAKVTMPRNVRFHQKYFVLLDLVFSSLPEGFCLETPDGQKVPVRSVDDLLWHIKMQLGHYEKKVTIGGRVTYQAKSISFGKMDNAAFDKFYSESIDIILKYFLVGVNREELEEEVIFRFG